MKEKRTNRLSCERARTYPIEKALAKLGHFPTKESNKEAWFLSPFRSETQASFKVSKKLNRWYDHGIGKGGNVIDLICLINNSSVKETLDWLQNVKISFSFQLPLFKEDNQDKIEIKYFKELAHFALREYVMKRGISILTARKLCKEVHYKFQDKMYFALGLANTSGGWELRNKYYKNSSSPKDVTHRQNGNSRLIVTEGMFDMLSLMERDKHLMEVYDLLILNSLGFIEKTFKRFDVYESIMLYLDNDHAGRNAVKVMMQQQSKCIDRSSLYENFKDVNAWWIAQNQ
ncbi:toprim domain-containing protein [Arenibacter sp. F26102]|uniref:toprim domain-containing protein n=1 Tax=Arenibacter sp. F26102 TaxID=2926416 RepID=UPI001FF38CA9|nr:toprim domain-containing protein [Arenibacter sp. F26102]MCK0147621.1 toprim domain-containing protein [Arenibacter sp. F26102]